MTGPVMVTPGTVASDILGEHLVFVCQVGAIVTASADQSPYEWTLVSSTPTLRNGCVHVLLQPQVYCISTGCGLGTNIPKSLSFKNPAPNGSFLFLVGFVLSGDFIIIYALKVPTQSVQHSSRLFKAVLQHEHYVYDTSRCGCVNV